MASKLYIVDAFTNHLFGGNPAAVCPLAVWLPDTLLQNIAMENNLSETAFYVPRAEDFHFDLRWFTPSKEVSLCGHATLAAGHVLFNILGAKCDQLHFWTKSGELVVEREERGGLKMVFPLLGSKPIEPPRELTTGLGNVTPLEVLDAGLDYLVLLSSEDEVLQLSPEFQTLAKVPTRAIVCTAAGTDVDFVSRVFAPAVGINEDPVTGSAHCELAAYWSNKLGKNQLIARQLSKRVGTWLCKYRLFGYFWCCLCVHGVRLLCVMW